MNIKSFLYRIKSECYIYFFLKLPKNKYITFQRKFLARTLRKAKKDVNYYKQLLSGKVINTNNCTSILQELPIIDKKIIRTEGSNIFADYVNDNWRAWHNTGGSTGSPLNFPIGGNSPFCLNGELFCQAWLYKLMAGSYHLKISSIDGRRVNDSDLANNIFWGKNNSNFPYGKTHYSTLYLTPDTFPYYLKHINFEKPAILRGYPSGIYEFAKLLDKSGYKLDFKLKAIYLTSENILDYQVSFIEKAFDCKVWGQYGHSEASIFAIMHPGQESYICNPLYGYVEVIGEDGKHVNKGQAGEIVVTGFQYSALPFIRYRTGDLAVYGGSKDGFVVLNKLLGRSGDYIIDKNGQKIYLVGFIFGGHLKAFNDISNWQITQNEPGKLTLKIVKGQNYTTNTEKDIMTFFGAKYFDVNILYVDQIEKTSRGKQPFMIQNL